FFFSSRRRHTRCLSDWSSDVCSSDLDYVVSYTNAATILTGDYAGPEDLDGVFSGLDAEQRLYDFASWRYQGGPVRPASGDRRPRSEERRVGKECRGRWGT